MYDRFDIAVGKKVRKARLEANLTQEQLAEKLGYTKQWVSQKEHGTYKMSLVDAVKIADACNVQVEYLTGVK